MTPATRSLWLAVLLGAITLGAPPTPAQQFPVRNYVARARASLSDGNTAGAMQLVRQALAEEPASADAHYLLGYLLARGHDREGAIGAWAQACALKPEWDVPRLELLAALREAAPAWVSPEAMERLPGEVSASDVRLRPDAGAVTRSAGCRVYTPPAEATPPQARDPKYQWRFPLHTYSYLRPPGGERWVRGFSVHYQAPEDAPLARRVAGLLGQLAAVVRERLEPAATAGARETHLWLCRRGSAGGEEWRGNLYLYDSTRARGPGEWVREVAHEYGHVAIPGTRHYTAPEPLGNGYLGERLLPLWLWDAGNARAWEGEADLAEYVRTRVLPASAAFTNAGPTAPARTDRGRSGMDYAIGLVLTLQLAHDDVVVDPLFRREIGAPVEVLLAAYRDRIRTLHPPSFRVRARAFVPARSEATLSDETATGRRLAYRLFLPAGSWDLSLAAEAVDGARMRMDGKSLPAIRTETFRASTATAGWHLLEVTVDEPVKLREIQVGRAGHGD